MLIKILYWTNEKKGDRKSFFLPIPEYKINIGDSGYLARRKVILQKSLVDVNIKIFTYKWRWLKKRRVVADF